MLKSQAPESDSAAQYLGIARYATFVVLPELLNYMKPGFPHL